MFDPLPDDLAAAVAAVAPRRNGAGPLYYCTDVDSTNDVLLTLSIEGVPEGTAVLAETQRAGRGRRGRTWFSPPGTGVYLSVLMRARPHTGPLPLVTLASGIAVARAIRAVTALPVELKWPNDVMIGRPWRKLAGVLCETAGLGSRVDAVIIGCGINLCSAAYPAALAARATSIEVELGRAIDRAPLVAEVLAALSEMMGVIHAAESAQIRHEWRALGRACLNGARVLWSDGDGARHGRAQDIDDDGALMVEVDGHVDRIVAGEVTWESLSDA
jgi:BirA family biotin operon repressor/biotin-[acetyl-CoA-carboxylase] ligase